MRASARLRSVVFFAAVAVTILSTTGVAHALLAKMSPSRLTRTADRVVEGRVFSVAPRHVAASGGDGWGTIVTVVRVRVLDDLKGGGPDWVTLRIPGGSVDGRTRVVEDAPAFYPGERCLVFLDEHGVVGWRQGVLPVEAGRVEAWEMDVRSARTRIAAVAAGRSVRFVSSTDGPAVHVVEAVPDTAPVARAVDSVAPRAVSTLLSDSFEGNMGLWTLYGAPTWGQTTYRDNGGTRAAYCAQSSIAAPGPYANSMSNWMIAGPFDLSDATAASLDFDHWRALGAGDSLYFGFSTNGSSFSLGGWTATSSGGWAHVSQDLGNWFSTSYLGQSSVWVAFRFVSDASTTAEGAYVDNVLLNKTAAGASDPVISGISPDTASAGTGTSVTISGANFGASKGAGGVTFYYDGSDRISAPIVSWSDTSVVCTVPTDIIGGYPASAASGPVIVTSDSGAASAGYPFTVTFSYGGAKWASPAVTYRINANCVDTASETALVDAAWPTWNPPSLWTLNRSGTCTTTSLPGTADSNRDIFWSQTTLGSGVLAVNQYWYSGSTIVDSDIAFNDAAFTWGDGSGGSFDIQTVALHELGHTVNLRDLYGAGDSADVMYGMSGAGTQKRTLSADDRAGAVWVYGARPPMTGGMKTNSDAAWTTSTTVTLNSSVANATQMRFQNAGGSWSGWEAYAATKAGWVLTAGDGAKTVNAEYRDAGGNVHTSSDAIGYDATAPSTGDTYGGPAARVRFTLTPGDTGSGVSSTEWRVDGGAWQSGTSVTLVKAIPHRRGGLWPGAHTVDYRSTDAAGNVESFKSRAVTLL